MDPRARTRLAYRESGGQRPGAPLLLVHGAGGSSAMWLGMLHRLGRLRRTVAVDLPGRGRSSGTAATVDELRDAVGELAATLCLGPSVIVGHSLGGLVALSAALTWPDKIAGLVLVTTGARLPVAPEVFTAVEQSFATWPDFLAQMAYSPETPAERRRRGARVACAASAAQTAADFRAASTCDLRSRLGEIRSPTLVLSGAHDLLTPPRWSERLASRIPGARHRSLPRCGHMPMHEQPDLLAAELSEFLGGISERTY